MSQVIKMKGARAAPASVKTQMDCIELKPDAVAHWERPPFQRPLKVNAKVRELIAELLAEPEIPGVITLGKLNGKTYVVDGQHRVEAYRQSEIQWAIANVRIVHFSTMADMSDEFIRLNSALVRLTPDDQLRAMESTHEPLQLIRKYCPYVGYGNFRRGNKSTNLLSMGTVIRMWQGSKQETPNVSGQGRSVVAVAEKFTVEEAQQLVQFLTVAHGAWGQTIENYQLWTTLNLTMTMWLWRACVTGKYSHKTAALSPSQFAKGLVALSADDKYVGWLKGRGFSDRSRGPCYDNMKAIFAHRLSPEMGKIQLPAPQWSRTGKSTIGDPKLRQFRPYGS